MMLMLMVLIDDTLVQHVASVVPASCRPRRAERPDGQCLQRGEAGDVVDGREPPQGPAGKVRDWESVQGTISTRVALQGRRSE